MSKTNNTTLTLDYYQQNTDYSNRILDGNNEKAIFPKDSSIRIWYNEQIYDYPSHWHNALEIIAPIDNYYDVEIEGEIHHVKPGDVIFIVNLVYPLTPLQ